MIVRPAERDDTRVLARLWRDGWKDAHAAILPQALVRARMRESFINRLEAAFCHTWVVGSVGMPLGFYMLKGDELWQLYVAAQARGTGVAAALIADAEARLLANGFQTTWLACAIGNERAARFYEKQGWHRSSTVVSRLDTMNGPFDLKVWRYEKCLISSSIDRGSKVQIARRLRTRH